MKNLIGISGKAGSGKDTVGEIIQNLTTPKGQKYLGDGLYSREIRFSPWRIKKFATKVKEVLSLLTGIPVEDFEKEEVKDSYMPEEWNRWSIDFELHKNFGIFSSEQLARSYASFCANKGKLLEIREERITYRQALQWIGTDLFRDKFHPNTWSTALFADYKRDIEIWKDIPKYEGIYQISSFGNVKRLARFSKYGDVSKGKYHTYKEKILVPTPSKGYLSVKLLNKETIFIHAKVAELFCFKKKDDKIVNHIDQNKLNNFYKNLEWTTYSKNILEANKYGNGNIGEKQHDSKLTDIKIKEIRNLLKSSRLNQREIATLYNVGMTTISDIKLNKKWKHVDNIQTIDPILPIKPSNWIITDTRFPNELEAIKERGGIVIRVNRPCSTCGKLVREENSLCSNGFHGPQHESETALDDYKNWDYVIDNNSDIPSLIEKVKQILIKCELL